MELITREICLRKDLGIHGNLFGGVMMSWLDKAGAIYSTQLCQSSRMVTGVIEEIKFIRNVKENTQVGIYGSVASLGNSSIVINIEARKYNVYTKEEENVCTTRMVFIRIDDDGKKRPLGEGAKRYIQEKIEENKI